MSDTQPDDATLDRAYTNGKLVGLLGLATREGCPFGGDQTGLRIAWLDGFAYGAWKAAAETGHPRPEVACPRADRPNPRRGIADIAVAHLFRISRAMQHDGTQPEALDSALGAAAAFSMLVRLTVD